MYSSQYYHSRSPAFKPFMVQRKMDLRVWEDIAVCSETVGAANITDPAFLQNENIFCSIHVARKYRWSLLLWKISTK